MRHRHMLVALVTAFCIACATTVRAQQSGEVFLSPFSAGLHAGSTGTVRVEFFGGNQPFGRVRGRMLWNPHALALSAPALPEARGRVIWSDQLTARYAVSPGVLEFEVTLIGGAQAPIGTVPIVWASAHALSPPGTVVPIDFELDAAECGLGCSYGHPGAMPGEVVVVGAGLPIPDYGDGANLRAPQVFHPANPLSRRARRIARGPGVIDLLIVTPAFAERRWVQAGPAGEVYD